MEATVRGHFSPLCCGASNPGSPHTDREAAVGCRCFFLSTPTAPSLRIHPSFQRFSSFPGEREGTAKACGSAMLCRCCGTSVTHCRCFLSQLFEDHAPNSQRPGTQLRRDLPAVRGRQRERGSAHHSGGMQAS